MTEWHACQLKRVRESDEGSYIRRQVELRQPLCPVLLHLRGRFFRRFSLSLWLVSLLSDLSSFNHAPAPTRCINHRTYPILLSVILDFAASHCLGRGSLNLYILCICMWFIYVVILWMHNISQKHIDIFSMCLRNEYWRLWF